RPRAHATAPPPGPPPPAIYPLSLHDALPICAPPYAAAGTVTTARRGQESGLKSKTYRPSPSGLPPLRAPSAAAATSAVSCSAALDRKSTRQLQSRENLVCRLLLEKKKNIHRK